MKGSLDRVRMVNQGGVIAWVRENGEHTQVIATSPAPRMGVARHRSRWWDPTQRLLGLAALRLGVEGVSHEGW